MGNLSRMAGVRTGEGGLASDLSVCAVMGLRDELGTCMTTVRCLLVLGQVCWGKGKSRGQSLHCALLLDYVPPEEPQGKPLGNALRIR